MGYGHTQQEDHEKTQGRDGHLHSADTSIVRNQELQENTFQLFVTAALESYNWYPFPFCTGTLASTNWEFQQFLGYLVRMPPFLNFAASLDDLRPQETF